jgi:muramoyltetrapeptide carboxypeptidase LdcA involved in peptidoglycan recycling
VRPMTVPARVREGDVVGVVSPAWGAVGALPHRAARARAYLERLGLRVRLMPFSQRNDGWASASPQERAEDINVAFAEPEITVILAGIGGNHSNQVLPHLDWEVISANPKIFQGFSDITVLHWALARNAGLRTLYGPSLITGLAEWPVPLGFTDAAVRAAWFGAEPVAFSPAPEWTDERVKWEREDRTAPRARVMRPNDGWHWLRGGHADGWLFGGCLETICWHLKGQRDWLDLDGAVLFLETSEEAPSPAHVDAYLTDLEMLGVFSRVAAVIVGRPANYSVDKIGLLERVVVERTAAAAIPVVANFDCGHTDPMLTLPFGTSVVVDSTLNSITCIEAATALR